MGLIPVGLSLRKVMHKSQSVGMCVSASVSIVTSLILQHKSILDVFFFVPVLDPFSWQIVSLHKDRNQLYI